MTLFARPYRFRFSDCDPAGIVFYPQYLVAFNGLVEEWFDAIGVGFRRLIVDRRVGIPTARLEADFRAVSHMGDEVQLVIHAVIVGHKSITLQLGCVGAEGESRMLARQILVTTSLKTHEAIEVPADIRESILRHRNAHAFVDRVGFVLGDRPPIIEVGE